MSGRGRQGSRFAQRYIDWFPSFVGAAPVPSTLPGARLIFGPTVPMTMGTQSEWWDCKVILRLCQVVCGWRRQRVFLAGLASEHQGEQLLDEFHVTWRPVTSVCGSGLV